MFDFDAAGIRSGRSDTRKRVDGRLLWAEAPEIRQLEERVLLSLTYTDFPIPLVQVVQPQGITTGPDGNLWFTENHANRIGRETPGGSLTEFALPANVISPGRSHWARTETSGSRPCKNLPMGASRAGSWGKITTAGVVSIDSLPAADSNGGLSGLTVALTGALVHGLTGKVGRMTTAGVESEFPVPEVPPPSGSPAGAANAQPNPLAITAGPDGNLWIISDNSRIWSVTTAGVFTGYQVAGLSGVAITAGPDGALWFTGLGEYVGRITTSGTVEARHHRIHAWHCDRDGPRRRPVVLREPNSGLLQVGNCKDDPGGAATYFDVTGNYSFIGGLTKGPDGNVWFTEEEDVIFGGQPAVARVTPGGVVTTYAIPPRMTLDPGQGVPVDPTAIIAGPDVALWFTEQSISGPGEIGRMTAEGTFSEIALPTPGASAVALTAGPDGAIWFTQTDDFDDSMPIGRITTDGLITEYPLAADARRCKHHQGVPMATSGSQRTLITEEPSVGSRPTAESRRSPFLTLTPPTVAKWGRSQRVRMAISGSRACIRIRKATHINASARSQFAAR